MKVITEAYGEYGYTCIYAQTHIAHTHTGTHIHTYTQCHTTDTHT